MMTAHFVTFYSPGTFVSEETTKPIENWDIPTALALAKGITERYNAKPYAFRFSTRHRGDADLDSREVAKSPMHYIGCKVETLAEVEARNDPREETLLWNMRVNKWDRIAVTMSGWKHHSPLMADDVVLDDEGRPL